MNCAVAPEKLFQIVEQDVQLIDIREPYQFNEQHIKNFQNIPYQQLVSQLPFFSKNKPIYLLC